MANKKLYFKLCFDSIYPIFKNIMGAVISAKDRDILKTSRPFRDVLLFNGILLHFSLIYTSRLTIIFVIFFIVKFVSRKQ